MDYRDLEKLGLNKNEAKIYHALLLRGEANAQELVKSLGVHRNIIYDNLEKLTEKGLVSFIVDGTKRKYVAEKPHAILEFLESKQQHITDEISTAKELIPQISKIIGSTQKSQDASLFRGTAGMKKVLAEIVQAKESWCIGITNDSVKILGETYWNNYNARKKVTKTHEWLLMNSDYKNTAIIKNSKSHHRVLPKELDQVTETIMYEGKTAIFVFSADPIVIVIENEHVFQTFRMHFEFLWKLAKEKK